MAKTLLELTIIEYETATFNEEAWRKSFDGIEQFTAYDSAAEYLEAKSDTSLYNPAMQLEDAPASLFLLTPIWSDE